MTEAELFEYRNSYSSFLNSIKEIYQSMESNLAQHLEFCKFAPDIDDETLKDYMNNYASKEESLEILCAGKAKRIEGSTGFFASIIGNSTDNNSSEFLFTTQFFYLKSHTIKLSEINSINYKEETKTSLFGKAKIESFLVVTKKTGITETFKGGIAVQAIAEFFNAIVKAFNENPQKELPTKEYPRSKLIVDAMNDLKISSLNRDFDHKVLNSIIIKYGKDELKASFAAHYNGLYFSNDYLYLTSNGNYKRIPYTDLLKVVYTNKEKLNSNGEIDVAYETSLYDKNNTSIFTTSNKSVNKDKRFADFFSMLVSNATGTEVKTEVQILKLPRNKIIDIIKVFIKEQHSRVTTTNIKHLVTDGCMFDFEYMGIYVAFCVDSVCISKKSLNKFEYNSISKACVKLEVKNAKNAFLSLYVYDNDDYECFSETPSSDLAKFARDLADVINKIASELTGKQIKTECIDTRPLEQLVELKGDVVSDSEEKRENWNFLSNKWNEIFSRETPIEFRRLTESEEGNLPEWIKEQLDVGHSKAYHEKWSSFYGKSNLMEYDREEYEKECRRAKERDIACDFYREYNDYFYYFIGKAIFKFNYSDWYYYPDPYSEDVKYLTIINNNKYTYYAGYVADLQAVSGKNSVEAQSNFLYLEGAQFFDGFGFARDGHQNVHAYLLGRKNYSAFIERLTNAKNEGLQKAKDAAKDAIEKKEQDFKNDINNW